MNLWLLVGGAVALLLALYGIGIPIFASFFILNILGLLLFFGPAGFGMFANSIFDVSTTEAFATIPLFILMGEIMLRSGSTKVMFDSLDTLIGRVRGRQLVLSMALSTIIGALAGTGMGMSAMLGRSVLPGMRERGYDAKLSIGTLLAGATLAPIIPPSVVAIIIGSLADVSIAALLIAGIVPGILLSALYLIYILVRVRLNPALAPRADAASGERRGKIAAILWMIPGLANLTLVMGLIMVGVATPSEAAAIAVVGTLVEAILYRSLTWTLITECLGHAARLSALLIVIMASSVMFGQLLAFSGATRVITETVLAANVAPWVMLWLMILLPFVLFMLLDAVSLMLVIIPLFHPIVKSLGFDPVWFWTIFLVNSSLGAMTPPFGVVLFAMKGATHDIPLTAIYGAAWPFVWVTVAGIVLMVLFPGLVTFLPAGL